MLATLDVLLAAGLVWLGREVVTGRSVFRSLVMFAVFGLTMAVAWARLGAVDVALAEAALGAGMTGAMLLLTYRRLAAVDPAVVAASRRHARLAVPVGVATGALVLALGLLLLDVPAPARTAGGDALAALGDTGLGNAVTAVLLLFRGYDTLLEMAVLLAAWLGVRLLQAAGAPAPLAAPAYTPLLPALLSVVVPSAVVVGGYLLHAGGQAPGGGFQAAAVLAAAGILLALSGRLAVTEAPHPSQRWVLPLGLVAFLVMGWWRVPAGGAVMQLAGTWAVYAIEVALTLSIAVVLVLLFLGAGGMRRRDTP